MRSLSDILTSLLQYGKENFPYMIWKQNTPQGDIIEVAGKEFERQYILQDYLKNISSLSGFKKIFKSKTLQQQYATAMNIPCARFQELLISDLDNYTAIFGYQRNTLAINVSNVNFVLKLYLNNNEQLSIPAGRTFTFKSYTDIKVTLPYKYVGYGELDENKSGYYITYIITKLKVSNFNMLRRNMFPEGSLLAADTYDSNIHRIELASSVDISSKEETGLQYINRIESTLNSKSISSTNNLKNFLLSRSDVYDINIILPNTTWYYIDPDTYETESNPRLAYTRQQGIDVWVYNVEDLQTVVVPSGTTICNNKPLYKDSDHITQEYPIPSINNYARSIFSNDTIDGTLTEYTYDYTIKDLQLYLENASNWEWGASPQVLVKKVFQIPIDITIDKLYTLAGYTPSSVETDIRYNLNVYFAGGITTYDEEFLQKKIAERIDGSDILQIILNTPGVDSLDVSSFVIKRQAPDIYTSEKYYTISGTVLNSGNNLMYLPIYFFEVSTKGTITITNII